MCNRAFPDTLKVVIVNIVNRDIQLRCDKSRSRSLACTRRTHQDNIFSIFRKALHCGKEAHTIQTYADVINANMLPKILK